MKNIHPLLLFSAIAIIALSIYGFTNNNSAKESEIVILQTVEPIGLQGQLLITSSDGTQKEFPLGSFGSKNHASTALLVAQKLQELDKAGFEIMEFSSAAAGNETSFVQTKTFVLRKK